MSEIPPSVYALFIRSLVAITIIALAWGAVTILKARVNGMKDQVYKKLAEDSLTSQRKLSDSQEKITEGMGDLRMRVAAIEKILREVE